MTNVCEDIFDTFLNMVRAPELVALDIRSMIACNHVARERLQSLFTKYGAATVAEISTTRRCLTARKSRR